MINPRHLLAGAALSLVFAAPVVAQEGVVADPPPAAAVLPETASMGGMNGDFLAVGVGAIYNPSYTGSDDYVLSPIPILFASYKGIELTPSGSGVSIDFIPDPAEGPGLILGLNASLRSDRASNIKDVVVKSLGKLDRAVELGPVIGVSIPKALNPYDSLSFSVSAGWDVAGAHKGMVIRPTASYFTPLSRGIIASLSLSAEYVDGKVADYYYRVTPAQSVTTGGVLPAFDPDGGGFTSAGANLLLGYDLDGDLTNGGLIVIGILGYSRVLGDAKASPFTSVRGSADQFLLGGGIGYTF